jgi:YhcH/YjgK/YiaL family protein
MVLDRIEQAAQYAGLGPGIARALEFLQRADLASLEPGRHELDGDRLFALVSAYVTRPVEPGKWEAHRRYLDLQSIVSGVERVGWAPVNTLLEQSRDDSRDIAWFSGSGQFVTLHPDDFLLLWPTDAHMPGIAVELPAAVKKIVVKIAVAPA